MFVSNDSERISINQKPKTLEIQAQEIIKKIDTEYQRRVLKLKPAENVTPFTVSVFLQKPGSKGDAYNVILKAKSQEDFDKLSEERQKQIVGNYADDLKNRILRLKTEGFILNYKTSQPSGPWKTSEPTVYSGHSSQSCCPNELEEVLTEIEFDDCECPKVECGADVPEPIAMVLVGVVAFACIFCIIPACLYVSYLGTRGCVFKCVKCATTRNRNVDGWELIFDVSNHY